MFSRAGKSADLRPALVNVKGKTTDRFERILTMVYIVVQNSQNSSRLLPSSGIPKNTTFRKLDLFPSSGEGGEEDTYSVGPLRERLRLAMVYKCIYRLFTDDFSQAYTV
jgi:hypothetical protein